MTSCLSEPPTDRRTAPRGFLPVILAAQSVIPLSIAGTAIALPQISDDIGADPVPLQWVVNGFNIAFALCTVVWGAAGDRLGHRRVFLAGVTVSVIGATGSAAARGLLALDASRAVAGVGAAAVLTGATALISASYSGAARTRAFAVFGTVNGLGLALGPSVSGALVSTLGWRSVFAAQGLVLGAALLASRRVPFSATGTAPGSSGPRGAVLDLSLLRRPRFAAMLLVPIAGAVGFVTFLTYLPNALGGIHGFTPDAAGLLMLAATAPVLVSPVVVGALVSRRRVAPGTVIGLSLTALVLGDLLMVVLRPGLPVVLVVVPMVLVGLGFGLPVGLVDGEALAAVPSERAGAAAGLLNLARIGSEAVAVAAYAALLSALITGRVGDPEVAQRAAAGHPSAPAAYADALHVVAPVLAAVVVVLALAVRWLLRPTGPQAAEPAGIDPKQV